MANPQTSATTSSNPNQRPGTAPASGKKADTKPADSAKVDARTNVKPWEDLPATPSMQKPAREKTTIWVVLELTKRKEGATEEEIKAAFGTMIAPDQVHHDPRRVMRFMSKERGWGFHKIKSGPNEGRIKLVDGREDVAK